MRQHGLPLAIKRAFDIGAASAALVGTLPIIAGTAVLVRATLGSPILFRQRRPGKDGALFTAYKFRTMRDEVDHRGRLLPDAARLTAVGRFLRRSSLDELPQLINVLRGEMSLVGPRPLLVQYLDRYNTEQRRRHDVLPGITGWAQINGRNATTWPQRFSQDVWYVDHWTPLLDLKILALTVVKVLRREGISYAGHETMPEFGTTEAAEVIEAAGATEEREEH